jgi:hypothetical protein
MEQVGGSYSYVGRLDRQHAEGASLVPSGGQAGTDARCFLGLRSPWARVSRHGDPPAVNKMLFGDNPSGEIFM